ncbi:MAG: hypothetical protein J5911_04645 [Clostridia bacterium]|nr:hypothetical protein [Clostridia bacterium]
MNTNKNGNPGKRLLGFFHIINLLPVVVIGEYFLGGDGIPTIYLPSQLCFGIFCASFTTESATPAIALLALFMP